MRKPDKLFDFIDAMNAHERGYFKREARPDSHYITLFDAIAGKKEYGEANLKKLLRLAGSSQKLPAVKDYLWHELVRTMSVYHLGKTPEVKAMEKIQTINLLWTKGLIQHIPTEINALEKLSTSYEQYEFSLLAQRLRYKLNTDHRLVLRDDFWEKYYETQKASKALIELLEIQQKMFGQLANTNEKVAARKKRVKEFITRPVLQDAILNGRPFLMMLREAIYAAYYKFVKDPKKCITHNLNCAAILENNLFDPNAREGLLTIYSNILIELLWLNDREYAQSIIGSLLDKVRDCLPDEPTEAWQLIQAQLIQMLIVNDFSDLGKLTLVLKRDKSALPAVMARNIYLLLVMCYYRSSTATQTMSFVSEAIMYCHENKLNTTASLKTVDILIRYELADYQYAQNQAQNFLRQHRQPGGEATIEWTTLKYVLKAIKSATPEVHFRKLAENITAKFPDDRQSIFMSYSYWAERMAARGGRRDAGGLILKT